MVVQTRLRGVLSDCYMLGFIRPYVAITNSTTNPKLFSLSFHIVDLLTFVIYWRYYCGGIGTGFWTLNGTLEEDSIGKDYL